MFGTYTQFGLSSKYKHFKKYNLLYRLSYGVPFMPFLCLAIFDLKRRICKNARKNSLPCVFRAWQYLDKFVIFYGNLATYAVVFVHYLSKLKRQAPEFN